MDKTVFITGASAGFGAACARRYAEGNNRLILVARRKERLKALQQELQGTESRVLELDVRRLEDIKMSLESLPREFRDIDILVNNAGLIYCTRLILPGMVQRKRGHIVNIGSVAGSTPYPGANVYGATKAFVKQFSCNLRSDLAGTRVRVTNIEPGLAETEFSLVRFNWNEERAAGVYKGPEPLTAEDIAEMVYWVTSLPPRINVNRLEVMPVCQSWAPFSIHREEE